MTFEVSQRRTPGGLKGAVRRGRCVDTGTAARGASGSRGQRLARSGPPERRGGGGGRRALRISAAFRLGGRPSSFPKTLPLPCVLTSPLFLEQIGASDRNTNETRPRAASSRPPLSVPAASPPRVRTPNARGDTARSGMREPGRRGRSDGSSSVQGTRAARDRTAQGRHRRGPGPAASGAGARTAALRVFRFEDSRTRPWAA